MNAAQWMVKNHARKRFLLHGCRAMIIRTTCHRQPQTLCVARSQSIPRYSISCIDRLDRIHTARRKMNRLNIAPLPEGMRLYHTAACGAHLLILLQARPMLHFWVCDQPSFIQAIDQIFIAVLILLPAKEHRKITLCAFLPCILIALAEQMNALRPWQTAVNAAISPEEMVGNDDSSVTGIHIFRNILPPQRPSARAGLRSMHMRLINVGSHDKTLLSTLEKFNRAHCNTGHCSLQGTAAFIGHYIKPFSIFHLTKSLFLPILNVILV